MNLIRKSFVTDGTGRFVIQLPADNDWGFNLCDDNQTWPGGFGSGMVAWRVVEAERVPSQERARLEWMLDPATVTAA